MKIFVVNNLEKGIEKAKEILSENVDSKTVLFLSGGKTPESLYSVLAKEKIIRPAAVAMIDERFGKKMHKNSNELMIKNTGFLDYIESLNVPFYPILTPDSQSRENTALQYDQTTRNLFFHFPKNIGILGVGEDGHTAGIPAGITGINEKIFEFNTENFVAEYNNVNGKYGERITLTFAGLSLLDFLIVFVFGKEKKQAIEKMFTQGSLSQIPARFFLKSEIAKKTVVITDQKI